MALYFQNLLQSSSVNIAFAYYDPSCGPQNQNFRKMGWWVLQPNQTFLAWNTDLRTVNRYVYFYAATNGEGGGLLWTGTGNAWLETTGAAFDQCAFDNTNCDQWHDFIQLDFGGLPGWLIQLGPIAGLYIPLPLLSGPGPGTS